MPPALPPLLRRLLPFLAWRSQLDAATVRNDLVVGFTVALVAIPQALAYAQLAGLPAYVGLYASLLPSIVGALWGSSAQLNTGPVALTSLLTAADPASALASLDQVDCRAILAAPSTLAAMREGAAAKQPRPAFVALTETGDSPSDTAADYWHPLPINPRQLARILRELTHGN